MLRSGVTGAAGDSETRGRYQARQPVQLGEITSRGPDTDVGANRCRLLSPATIEDAGLRRSSIDTHFEFDVRLEFKV